MSMKRRYYLKQSLEEAEAKARIRDFNTIINLDEVARQERIANERGFQIIPKRLKNKIAFNMIGMENLDVLNGSGYLSNVEYGVFYRLQAYVAMGSNAIKHSNGEFMTVTEIAEKLLMPRPNVSNVIKRLIEKGLLYEFVPVQEIKLYNRNVNARPLFINPELNFRGDRNKIDPALCDMVMKFDYLEKNKILLPNKVWHANNEKYGKLVSRKTYLKLKKEQKEKAKKM